MKNAVADYIKQSFYMCIYIYIYIQHVALFDFQYGVKLCNFFLLP